MVRKSLRLTIGVFTILPAFVGFGWFLYSLACPRVSFSSLLLILGFAGLMLAAVFTWTTRCATRDGVLNEDGREVYYLWTSFENMLRDIAHLDQAEH